MTRLTLTRPDDFHLHLRDGAMLQGIAPESARDFARAIIMPNLVPPVVTGAEAAAYRERIAAALPGADFTPLMTLYLTEQTDPADLVAAHKAGIVTAVKLYPAGATTNSASGVTDFTKVAKVFEAMAEAGVPLCVHGEVTAAEIDIFDREAVFIETVLDPIRRAHPGLKVIMEHVTTKDAVDYVRANPQGLGATITTHHLILNRNSLLVGGMRPHYFCLPVAKRELHRQALVEAALSGDPRFFLGTDSAPHSDDRKECACCAAGCFTATNTMPILAQIFDREGRLDRLEGFTSHFGADFYGLARNAGTITLEKTAEPVRFPAKIETGAGPVTVFEPGFDLYWRVAG
ncbi:dihydroorotase [Pararhodobacter aggregans]|uniref:Dihydroorotase n=1 Tax=Pararhodobacter aggregans TaxID=404875 RepID=A0A2T7UVV8_9RHOB|nr:dihydroorotase [Pararhodobacter aggregans]PTX03798.1 dihydroorotase [Pararhodobacter aggregans]PVE48716.1 dihydroorotase [Pararhodobacter aggregans]